MKTIINDTCDVVMTRISDNKVVFTGEAQLASIAQTVQEDKVQGGIGNRVIAILRSQKNVDLTVRNAVFDSDYIEVMSGGSFTSKAGVVFKKEENLTMATKAVTISGTPKTGGIIKVIAPDGKQYAGTFATDKITTTDGVDGPGYTAIYQADITGANTLSIDATKFSERYKVEYHTIEYNVVTNAIVNDLYFQFDSVLPSGNFTLSFENGNAQTPEMNLMALCPIGSNEIGRVIEVTRA